MGDLRHWIMGAAAMAMAAPVAAAEANIWSTSFDTGNFEVLGPFPFFSVGVTFGGGSLQSAIGFPGFGTQMFRNDTGGTTLFDATGLGAHTHLRLKFDLAFIDSWDGLATPAFGPDILYVNIDGTEYQWSVRNTLSDFFDIAPGTIIASGTNLGFNPGWNDTIVRYEFLFPHTAPNFLLSIRFGGAGFQGGIDESWGIDNFALSAIFNFGGAIPEPATWAMLIAGFGLVGIAARQRRPAKA